MSGLSKVVEQLEQELEELTASLFEVRAQGPVGGVCWASIAPRLTQSLPSSQEAHRMVRTANMKQAASEKQLKEARGKVRPSSVRTSCPPSQPCMRWPLRPNRTLA